MKVINSNIDFSDVPVRVISWLYIIVIISFSLLHPVITGLAGAILSYGCMREYFSINKCEKSICANISYTSILLQLVFYIHNSYIEYAAFITIYSIITLLISGKKIFFYGIIICAFLIGTLSFIRFLNIAIYYLYGIKHILFLIILTAMNDVFQYLTGQTLGQRKVSPKISPNNTVHRMIGGIILSAD